MKKRVRIILSWAAVVFMAAVIFGFSAQHSSESAKISLSVKSWLSQLLDSIGLLEIASSENFHNFIRKTAHFILYFVFGFLSANAFCQSLGKTKNVWRFSFLMSVLYASSDEIHQYFVPGRGPGIGDVLLDSVAALCGVLVFGFLLNIICKRK